MQQRRSFFLAGLTFLCLALALFLPAPAGACPFCSAPSLTLSEQYARADAALLDTYEPERIAFARRLVSTTDQGFTGVTSDSTVARGTSESTARSMSAKITTRPEPKMVSLSESLVSRNDSAQRIK